MKSLKILIVEDEIIIARDVARSLEEIGCEVCGIILEGEEVLPSFSKEVPDIVLMDIALRGKLDGISTAHLIQEHYEVPIIYLTANTDDFTFEKAKATHPFAFIEKPFKKRQLIRTVELLIEQLLKDESPEEESEQTSFILNDRIFVREKSKMVKIFLRDLLYIEADRAYSHLVTREKTYLLASSLSNIENKLPPEFLMRVHRSYMVNLQEIESIEEGYVCIQNKRVPVSRSHWEKFVKRVNII